MATISFNCSTLSHAVKKNTFSSRSRVAALAPKVARSSARASFRTSAQVGIFFSTTTGNTEEVADLLSSELDSCADPVDVGDIADDIASLTGFDGLIVGAPTWNTGADEMRSGTSWDDVLEQIGGMDFSGKKVAVFGCGDSSSYSDYFCDAIEEVYSVFKNAGADMVGNFPCDDYEFEESKSTVDGPSGSDDAAKLLGLAIDVENQSDLTEDRVSKWAAQLKTEMSL